LANQLAFAYPASTLSTNSIIEKSDGPDALLEELHKEWLEFRTSETPCSDAEVDIAKALYYATDYIRRDEYIGFLARQRGLSEQKGQHDSLAAQYLADVPDSLDMVKEQPDAAPSPDEIPNMPVAEFNALRDRMLAQYPLDFLTDTERVASMDRADFALMQQIVLRDLRTQIRVAADVQMESITADALRSGQTSPIEILTYMANREDGTDNFEQIEENLVLRPWVADTEVNRLLHHFEETVMRNPETRPEPNITMLAENFDMSTREGLVRFLNFHNEVNEVLGNLGLDYVFVANNYHGSLVFCFGPSRRTGQRRFIMERQEIVSPTWPITVAGTDSGRGWTVVYRNRTAATSRQAYMPIFAEDAAQQMHPVQIRLTGYMCDLYGIEEVGNLTDETFDPVIEDTLESIAAHEDGHVVSLGQLEEHGLGLAHRASMIYDVHTQESGGGHGQAMTDILADFAEGGRISHIVDVSRQDPERARRLFLAQVETQCANLIHEEAQPHNRLLARVELMNLLPCIGPSLEVDFDRLEELRRDMYQLYYDAALNQHQAIEAIIRGKTWPVDINRQESGQVDAICRRAYRECLSAVCDRAAEEQTFTDYENDTDLGVTNHIVRGLWERLQGLPVGRALAATATPEGPELVTQILDMPEAEIDQYVAQLPNRTFAVLAQEVDTRYPYQSIMETLLWQEMTEAGRVREQAMVRAVVDREIEQSSRYVCDFMYRGWAQQVTGLPLEQRQGPADPIISGTYMTNRERSEQDISGYELLAMPGVLALQAQASYERHFLGPAEYEQDRLYISALGRNIGFDSPGANEVRALLERIGLSESRVFSVGAYPYQQFGMAIELVYGRGRIEGDTFLIEDELVCSPHFNLSTVAFAGSDYQLVRLQRLQDRLRAEYRGAVIAQAEPTMMGPYRSEEGLGARSYILSQLGVYSEEDFTERNLQTLFLNRTDAIIEHERGHARVFEDLELLGYGEGQYGQEGSEFYTVCFTGNRLGNTLIEVMTNYAEDGAYPNICALATEEPERATLAFYQIIAEQCDYVFSDATSSHQRVNAYFKLPVFLSCVRDDGSVDFERFGQLCPRVYAAARDAFGQYAQALKPHWQDFAQLSPNTGRVINFCEAQTEQAQEAFLATVFPEEVERTAARRRPTRLTDFARNQVRRVLPGRILNAARAARDHGRPFRAIELYSQAYSMDNHLREAMQETEALRVSLLEQTMAGGITELEACERLAQRSNVAGLISEEGRWRGRVATLRKASRPSQPRNDDGTYGEKPGGSVNDVVREAYTHFGRGVWTLRRLRDASDLIRGVSETTNNVDIRAAIKRGLVRRVKHPGIVLTPEGRRQAELLGAKAPAPVLAAVPAQPAPFYDRGRRTPEQQQADIETLRQWLDRNPLDFVFIEDQDLLNALSTSTGRQLSYRNLPPEQRAAIAYWDLRRDELNTHPNNLVESTRPDDVILEDVRHMRSVLDEVPYGQTIDSRELSIRACIPMDAVQRHIHRRGLRHRALIRRARVARTAAERTQIHEKTIEILEAFIEGRCSVAVLAERVTDETGLEVTPEHIKRMRRGRTFPQDKRALLAEKVDYGKRPAPKVAPPEVTRRRELTSELIDAHPDWTAERICQELEARLAAEGITVPVNTFAVWSDAKKIGKRPKGTARRTDEERRAHRQILEETIMERKLRNEPCNYELLAEIVNDDHRVSERDDIRPATRRQIERDLTDKELGLHRLRPLPDGRPYSIRTEAGPRPLTLQVLMGARPSQRRDILNAIAGGGLFNLQEELLLNADFDDWQLVAGQRRSEKQKCLMIYVDDHVTSRLALSELRTEAWLKLRAYLAPFRLEDLGEYRRLLTPREQAVASWHFDPHNQWSDEVKCAELAEIEPIGDEIEFEAEGAEVRPIVTPEALRDIEQSARTKLFNNLPPDLHTVFFAENAILPARMPSMASDPDTDITTRITHAVEIHNARTPVRIASVCGLERPVVESALRNQTKLREINELVQRRPRAITGKGHPGNLLRITDRGYGTTAELARRAGVAKTTAGKDLAVLFKAGVLDRDVAEQEFGRPNYLYRLAHDLEDEKVALVRAYLNDLFDTTNPRNKGNITKYREDPEESYLIRAVRSNFVEVQTLPRQKEGGRSAQSIYNADATLAGKVISQVKRLQSVGKHFEDAPRTYIFTINEHNEKTTPMQREEAKRQAEAIAQSMGVELIIRPTTRVEDPTFRFECRNIEDETIGTASINQYAYEESLDRTSNILSLGFAASSVPHYLDQLIPDRRKDYTHLLSHINNLYRSIDILERNLIDITDLQVAPHLITDILHNSTINIILPPVRRENFEKLDEFDMQYRALEKFA